MADTKITALTADTSPTSDDLIPTVTDPAGTPANRKVTLANAITKAHGLSDGLVKVASGTMGNATANTDYYAPKAKLDATTAPGSANDNTQGYAVGSVWVDVTGDKSYIAVDVSTGAAVWNDLTASAGGGISNVVEDLTPQLGGDLDLNAKNITAGATTISPTEVSYLDGVTSNIQTQFTGKQDVLTGLTSSVAELNILDGATLDVTELNYVDGVTSAIQTQLNAKQASGATLTSLEGLTLGAGDLLYATAADTLTDLAIGTANQVLAVNAGATAPEWKTISSGGQTLYDRVVAASGGDHTTLQDALTAASAGETIFVRSGTYSLAANTSSILDNITIVGENPITSIIAMTTYNLTLSGVGVRLQNIGFTKSTGDVILSGTNSKTDGIYMAQTGTDYGLSITGSYSSVVNSYFTSTSTSQRMINLGASHCKAVGNTYNGTGSGSATIGVFYIDASYCTIANNNLYVTSGTDTPIVAISSNSTAGAVVADNNIYNSTTVCRGVYNAGTGTTVSGNSIAYCKVGIYGAGGNYHVYSNNNIVQSTTTNTYGIYAVATYTTVSGNMIFNSAAGVAGIFLGAVSQWTITGNNVQGSYTTGITVGDDTSGGVITGNVLGTSLTTAISMGNDRGHTVLGNSGVPITQEKRVIRMKNTSGGSLGIGDVVVWKAVAAGDEFTTTTTAGDDKVLGVLMNATVNNGYGFVQTEGKVITLKVDGTTDIAVGDPLTTFTTATIAAKAAAGDMVFAYALEAYTANDSLGVIDALLISPRLI